MKLFKDYKKAVCIHCRYFYNPKDECDATVKPIKTDYIHGETIYTKRVKAITRNKNGDCPYFKYQSTEP